VDVVHSRTEAEALGQSLAGIDVVRREGNVTKGAATRQGPVAGELVLDPSRAANVERAIDPEEYLLRRIHRNVHTPDQPTQFTRDAFKPTRDDTDGISLNREGELNAAGMGPADMSAKGRKPGEYFVVRLKAKVYIDLGLVPGGHAFAWGLLA